MGTYAFCLKLERARPHTWTRTGVPSKVAKRAWSRSKFLWLTGSPLGIFGPFRGPFRGWFNHLFCHLSHVTDLFHPFSQVQLVGFVFFLSTPQNGWWFSFEEMCRSNGPKKASNLTHSRGSNMVKLDGI